MLNHSSGKKYAVNILPAAWEDLQTIQDYYLFNAGAASAQKVIATILFRLRQLETFPLSGSRVTDEWLAARDYRMLVCDRHIVIYKLIEHVVYVYRIVDALRDYPRLFAQ